MIKSKSTTKDPEESKQNTVRAPHIYTQRSAYSSEGTYNCWHPLSSSHLICLHLGWAEHVAGAGCLLHM